MMFPCDKCGACCRSLHRSALYADLDRGDGICRYLTGNLCSIYPQRPLLCRVEDSYHTFFSNALDWETYRRLNQEACVVLRNAEKER